MDHLQHKDKYQLELKEQEFSNQHQWNMKVNKNKYEKKNRQCKVPQQTGSVTN